MTLPRGRLGGTLGPASRGAYDAGLTPLTFALWRAALGTLGLLAIIVVAVSAYWSVSSRDLEKADARRIVPPPEVDPFEGGYPVPPMPGQTIRRTAGPILAAQVAAVGARSDAAPAGRPEDDEEVHGG